MRPLIALEQLEMSKKVSFGLFALALLCAVKGKTQSFNYLDPNNFTGIWSEGKIPADFTESWAAKVQKGLSEEVLGGAKHIGSDDLNDFWSINYYFIDQLLQNGSVSFQ